MQDEFQARLWAAHHHHFAGAIAQLWCDLRFAFERLASQRYDAPWERGRRTDHCR